jgi:hypothetical protein
VRYIPVVFALTAALFSQGCLRAAQAVEAIAPKCTQEQIVVTWPVTITRGTAVTSTLLTNTLTQTNIDRAQFDALRATLTAGGPGGTYNVTWGIPAFETNGGYIALQHVAPIQAGETQQVGAVFSGGGWGAQPATSAVSPVVSLRASNFVATSATGSITSLGSAPLRLRIDITTVNQSGETIRVAGEAGFAYNKVIALCN